MDTLGQLSGGERKQPGERSATVPNALSDNGIPIFGEGTVGGSVDEKPLQRVPGSRRAAAGLRRPSHDQRRHSPARRIELALLSGVLVGAVIAGGMFVTHHFLGGSSRVAQVGSPVRPATRPHGAASVHRSNSASSAKKARPPASSNVGISTTTTLSDTTYSQVYTVPSVPYSVVVSVTNNQCWVEAIDPSSGAVEWAGTLSAGQQQSLPGTGPMQLQLGAATSANVELNGNPVLLPSVYQSPFTMSFVPGQQSP